MPYITKSRRAAIIKRDSHGAAQLGVSQIEDAGALCSTSTPMKSWRVCWAASAWRCPDRAGEFW